MTDIFFSDCRKPSSRGRSTRNRAPTRRLIRNSWPCMSAAIPLCPNPTTSTHSTICSATRICRFCAWNPKKSAPTSLLEPTESHSKPRRSTPWPTSAVSTSDLDVTSPRRFEHRQKVMNEITPEKWSTYLAQWKVEQTERTATKSRGDLVYTIEKARAGLERMGLTQDDSDRVRCILFDMHDQHIEAYVRVHGGD